MSRLPVAALVAHLGNHKTAADLPPCKVQAAVLKRFTARVTPAKVAAPCAVLQDETGQMVVLGTHLEPAMWDVLVPGSRVSMTLAPATYAEASSSLPHGLGVELAAGCSIKPLPAMPDSPWLDAALHLAPLNDALPQVIATLHEEVLEEKSRREGRAPSEATPSRTAFFRHQAASFLAMVLAIVQFAPQEWRVEVGNAAAYAVMKVTGALQLEVGKVYAFANVDVFAASNMRQGHHCSLTFATVNSPSWLSEISPDHAQFPTADAQRNLADLLRASTRLDAAEAERRDPADFNGGQIVNTLISLTRPLIVTGSVACYEDKNKKWIRYQFPVRDIATSSTSFPRLAGEATVVSWSQNFPNPACIVPNAQVTISNVTTNVFAGNLQFVCKQGETFLEVLPPQPQVLRVALQPAVRSFALARGAAAMPPAAPQLLLVEAEAEDDDTDAAL